MEIGNDGGSDDSGLGVGCRVRCDADVVQELGRGGLGTLKVPRLVKLGMVTALDDPGV